MNYDYNNIDLIEKYIDHSANDEERLKAEQMLNVHPDLQEEYNYMKLAVDAVKRSALHKQVGNIAKAYNSKQRQQGLVINNQQAAVRSIGFYGLRAAAVITLIFASYVAIQYATISSDKLYTASFVDYNLPTTRSAIKEINIDALYKMGKWDAVLNGVTKENSQKERFLAGMSALHLNKPIVAAEFFEGIIEGNKKLKEYTFTQESEFYLAMASLKNKNYNKAKVLINSIQNNPEHIYYTQAKKISFLKTMLLSLK